MPPGYRACVIIVLHRTRYSLTLSPAVVMLELSKVIDQVDDMSREIARRQGQYRQLVTHARQALANHDRVDDALMAKIERARKEDSSWRGARPCGDSLNARFIPPALEEDATLIGVDGSQIYPNRHGPALYYLINTGAIVLRQGSGEAPLVHSRPQVFFAEDDLYDQEMNLVNSEDVNTRRELEEMRELSIWSQAEKAYWNQDARRLILAMTDGPLLIWIGEKKKDAESEKAVREQVQAYLEQLQRIQQSGAIPIGYVARPRSANVVRLLHVAQLDENELTQERIRASRYRALTDATLFKDLAPNQRTALFSSTSQVNKTFADAGQEICFFYLNVSRDPDAPRIARVDIPKWAALQPGLLDRVHRAIYRDCDGTDYPYVLIRAHELALVTYQERQDLEAMLNIAYMKLTGESLSSSIKETLKGSF